MLIKYIFHEPIISCDTLYRFALCLTSTDFTQVCLLWVLYFNHSRKILFFPEIVTFFFILHGALQPCCLVNVLKTYMHAWWSTQSRLATLLSSLIARRWIGFQTLWWFRLKDLSIDEMVGAWCFGCLSGPPGFTCYISFAPVFSFVYCWVLIFALSPCYILIYMF